MVSEICRLCYECVCDAKIIEEIKTEVLEVLTIKLDLSLSENPVMCSTCWEKVEECFNFKTNCIYTEDYITPFVKNNDNLDLKQIYSCKLNLEIVQSQNVCRLCMTLNCDDVLLNEEEEKLFQKYFPEININLTSTTMICSRCYLGLQSYFQFVSLCIEREKKLKQYCKAIRRRCNRKIYLKNFQRHIKDKPLKEEVFLIINDNTELNIKHELNLEEEDERCEVNGVQDDDKEFRCNVCSYVSTSRYYIKTHKLSHKKASDVKLYSCTKCPLQTKYKMSLKKHIKVAHSGSSQEFICNDCGFTTKHKISLVRHVKQHKDLPVYKCENCPLKTKNMKTLNDHVCKIKTPKKIYSCKMCPLRTTRRYQLSIHMRNVHDQGEVTWYNCKICLFRTKYQRCHKKHLKVHERSKDVKVYRCTQCKYTTLSDVWFRRHLSIHDEILDIDKDMLKKEPAVKSLKCSQCDFKCVRSKTLLKHEFAHSSDKPFRCEVCSFRTSSLKNLASHKVIHRDRTFKCDKCDYIGKTSRWLRLHMNKHASNPKMYRCDQCSFESRWRDSYNTHKALHSTKVFKCSHCDFQTRHRKSISTHITNIHESHKLPLYKCDKCSYQTRRKDSILNHALVHKDATQVKMYKCTECKFESKYKRSLRNHLRDQHNPENTKNETEDSSDTTMFMCANCSFGTKEKSNLRKHIQNKHSSPDSVKIYECDKCSFKTKLAGTLKNHLMTHMEAVKMFKCNDCDFETRYPRSLKNHISNKHESWKVITEGDHHTMKQLN